MIWLFGMKRHMIKRHRNIPKTYNVYYSEEIYADTFWTKVTSTCHKLNQLKKTFKAYEITASTVPLCLPSKSMLRTFLRALDCQNRQGFCKYLIKNHRPSISMLDLAMTTVSAWHKYNYQSLQRCSTSAATFRTLRIEYQTGPSLLYLKSTPSSPKMRVLANNLKSADTIKYRQT